MKKKSIGKKSKKKKRKGRGWGVLYGYNETLGFIDGFTPEGIPYGVTWEEWRAPILWDDAPEGPMDDDFEDDAIPF